MKITLQGDSLVLNENGEVLTLKGDLLNNDEQLSNT